jgi:hypothetical protein
MSPRADPAALSDAELKRLTECANVLAMRVVRGKLAAAELATKFWGPPEQMPKGDDPRGDGAAQADLGAEDRGQAGARRRARGG